MFLHAELTVFTEIILVLYVSTIPFSCDPPQKMGLNQDKQLKGFSPNSHQYISEVKPMAHYVSVWISMTFSYGTQFHFPNIQKDRREMQLITTRHLSKKCNIISIIME